MHVINEGVETMVDHLPEEHGASDHGGKRNQRTFVLDAADRCAADSGRTPVTIVVAEVRIGNARIKISDLRITPRMLLIAAAIASPTVYDILSRLI